MKKFHVTFVLFIATFFIARAQSFDFEDINSRTGMPVGWMRSDRQASVDSVIKHSGNFSLRIDGATSAAVASMPFLYDGTKLEISGYIRIDNIAGRAEIKASLNAGPNLQQNPEDHIVTRSVVLDECTGGEWKAFSFEMPLCNQITDCDMSIILNGAGKIWVDDISMLIDGQPLDSIDTRSPADISFGAQEDTRFDDGSRFTVDKAFTQQQTENLMVLSRVWGFLKYYHPAVARGEYNWDYELFGILPRVLDLEPEQRNQTLYEWVCGLGEIAPGEGYVQSPIRWISDKDMLGDALSDKLLSIARSERELFNYYLTTVYGYGLALHKNENPYPEMDYSDTGVKLAAAFRLWNAIEYFYPYKHLTDDWDKGLETVIQDMSESTDRIDYLLSIYRLLCRLNDSHAAIEDPAQTLSATYKYAMPFVSRSYVDGKFVVTQAFGRDSLSDLRVGDAIVGIGGKSIAEYLTGLQDRIPASNFGALARDASQMINYTSKEEYVTFTIDRDDRIIEQKVKAYSFDEYYEMAMEFYAASGKQPENYKIINDSVAYIQMTQISRSHLDSVFNIYITYPKMVLDMRGYPEGYILNYITRLIPGYPMVARNIRPDINLPGSFDVVPGDYIGGGNISFAPRKIAVLVDQQTQSMAEYMVMALQNAPNVITVGSQTAGADGSTTFLLLPGYIMAKFTGLGVLYPDGGETQGVGVRIDKIVTPTLKGIREGRDEQLEVAIEIL